MMNSNVKNSKSVVSKRYRNDIDFSNDPILVNPQYKHKTLGELITIYKRTGEFPAVGVHNGVYFARGIDDNVPALRPMDAMQTADNLKQTLSDYSKFESEANEVNEKMRNDELSKLKQKVAELESQNVVQQPLQK